MAETDPDSSADLHTARWRLARNPWVCSAAALAAMAIALAWTERIEIAQRLIDQEMQQLKLSARYRIDEVGTGREVLSDISIGDPSSPDFIAKTLEIDTGWSGGLPGVTRIKLVGALLRARISNGHLSFGRLDPMIFAPSRTPFRLPDIALNLQDSGMSIAQDGHPIRLSASGDGNLRDGFAGSFTSGAPFLQIPSCFARGASFDGRLAIRNEQPSIIGLAQMARLTCPGPALALQAPAGQVSLLLNSGVNAGMLYFALNSSFATLRGQSASRLMGGGVASLQGGALSASFALGGDMVSGENVRAKYLDVKGQLRASAGGGIVNGAGTLSGRDVAPQANVYAAITRAQESSAGTMAAPLLGALKGGIAREAAASRLYGSWVLRRSGSGTGLMLPELHIDGGQTAHWLSLSRIALKQSFGAGGLAVGGNFAVTGKGFPGIHGQIRPLADGGGAADLTIPTWAAAGSSLTVPLLAAKWHRAGRVEIDGAAVVSGPVSGSRVTGLTIPLNGRWSSDEGLLLGSRCGAIGFLRLAAGGLQLDRVDPAKRALTVCPGVSGGAMVALGPRGSRLSVQIHDLRLAGRLNGSAVRLAMAKGAMTWPGGLSLGGIDLTQLNPGPAATAPGARSAGNASEESNLHLAQLSATFGQVTTGHFEGGDIGVATTPGVLRSATGDFRWSRGRLTASGVDFRIEDLSSEPRFAPIVANGATAVVSGGLITGTASLRASAADRELVRLTVVHDLASGRGHADVSVPGLTFDQALQPKQLTTLTEGVIADVKGTLKGTGRFDWAHGHVTSSARISTDGFDFAAAFGPVKGVVGTIEFTDALGLVTAPDQKLAIAMINPGIEVDDGILTFALQPGHVLALEGAKWPFLDGTLALLPTRLVLGATEERRYELRVDGLNAAKFLARMDLSNLAADGTFDGNLPLIFDANGGRIENGQLLSRPPGGTVSYVGALTYKDLSPMANYAFQALRALKYRQMLIRMDGPLAGDIVTRVSMQGVGQGKGAKRNFITNQIARLPIRFDVNITAPFMQLVTSFRSLYDPALVADPRALGLIDAQGRPATAPVSTNLPTAKLPPPPSAATVQP